MKNLFIMFFSFIFALSTNAQDFEKRKEKIKALKVAVISQKLDLTSTEAEKFWPIYNKFEDKIAEIRTERIKTRFKSKNATDEDAIKTLEEREDADFEISKLKKQMRTELTTIIGPKKVLMLQKIEQDFKNKILEKLKDRKQRRNRD